SPQAEKSRGLGVYLCNRGYTSLACVQPEPVALLIPAGTRAERARLNAFAGVPGVPGVARMATEPMVRNRAVIVPGPASVVPDATGAAEAGGGGRDANAVEQVPNRADSDPQTADEI